MSTHRSIPWKRVFTIRTAGLFLLLTFLFAACAPNTGLLGGGTWQSTNFQQHILTFTVDTNNPQHLYAGSATQGVYVSIDGGQHWTQESAGLPTLAAIHALSFDIPNKKLYAATSQGLFISTNGAQQWSAASSSLPADSYTALAFDVNAPQVVYVGTAQHGVWMSQDDGTHWTQQRNGLPSNAVIENLALDPISHLLWAATSVGVYRADAQGSNWQAANTGLPAGPIFTVVPAAASGGTKGLLYAGTTIGVYFSSDNGLHWTTNNQALTGAEIFTLLLDFRSSNVTTIYAGTSVGAFRSDNSGVDWAGIATGLPRDGAVYALTLGATGYTQLYAAETQGVYVFPGSSGGFNISHLLPLLVIVLLFVVLYQFTIGRRNRQRKRQSTTSVTETPAQKPS